MAETQLPEARQAFPIRVVSRRPPRQLLLRWPGRRKTAPKTATLRKIFFDACRVEIQNGT
jgi:hypothetical protein